MAKKMAWALSPKFGIFARIKLIPCACCATVTNVSTRTFFVPLVRQRWKNHTLLPSFGVALASATWQCVWF